MTGLVYVFTGDGKGKTSAAIGVATRSLLLGKKVVWIAFYKQASWGIAEAKLTEKFPNLQMHFVGKGFQIPNGQQLTANGTTKIAKVAGGAVVVDTASEGEHKQAAALGLRLAREQLAGHPFLLVMDEVLNAIVDGLVGEGEVLEILSSRGDAHVLLTGRGATTAVIDSADLVTECRKVKHPYDAGKLAVPGLDF